MSYKRARVVIAEGKFWAVDPDTGEVVAEDRSYIGCASSAWGKGFVVSAVQS